jgi:hypothetical protein
MWGEEMNREKQAVEKARDVRKEVNEKYDSNALSWDDLYVKIECISECFETALSIKDKRIAELEKENKKR